MGEAKRREKEIGICIYCGSTNNLSDEHVLPYGLGGDLMWERFALASCVRIFRFFEQGSVGWLQS
jgi:5-methylcytosine-specific restriction endonuclease McrA